MSEKDNGGAAFPTPWAEGSATEGGMSLRDWFAGKVLGDVVQVFDRYAPDAGTHENFAKEAYKIADAMLKERNK